MMRVALLLVVTCASVAAGAGCPAGRWFHYAAAGACLPYRIVWRGTLSAEGGGSSSFVAKTHFVNKLPEGLFYEGRFSCRGSACPKHRGHAEVVPLLDADVSQDLVFMGPFMGGLVYCGCDPVVQPASDFRVECHYTCARRDRDRYVHPFGTGTASLIPSRIYQPDAP